MESTGIGKLLETVPFEAEGITRSLQVPYSYEACGMRDQYKKVSQ